MKTLLLLMLLMFSCLEQILNQEFRPENEEWTNGRYETKAPLEMSFKALRMSGLSPRHFFGLMGKRSSAKSQITRKRQKFQAFVGLMGKRNVEGLGASFIFTSIHA